MPQIRRILVPVDFSEQSRRALDYAIFIAQRFEAEMDVLHVWMVSESAENDAVVQPRSEPELPLATYLRRQAYHALTDFLSGLPYSKPLLEEGDPAPVILRVAKERGYDLVVMGTHGRTGLSHLMMGSVAENVVRLSPCPVLTCRVPDTKK